MMGKLHTKSFLRLFAVVLAFFFLFIPNNTAAEDTFLNLDNTWSFYNYGETLIIAVPPSGQDQNRIAFFEPGAKKEGGKIQEFKLTPNTKDFGQPSSGNPTLMPEGCIGSHIDLAISELSGDSGQSSQTTVSSFLFRPDKGSCSDDDFWQNRIFIEKAPDSIVERAKIYNPAIFENRSGNGTPSAALLGANATPDGQSVEDRFEACFSSLPFVGWALCPMVPLANGVYNFFFGVVGDLLFIESKTYDREDTRELWRNFTNIANSILVIIGLIIILSQIFNFEFISAYTVKKALPRLVIGAILIQLSWFIFTLLIQFINAIGYGLYDLLLTPFPQYQGEGYLDIGTILTIGGDDSVGVADMFSQGIGAVVGSIAVVGVALSGAWLTILITLIAAIIGMLIALFVLIFREGLILILLVVSPIALALWILPGTSKYWKIWWDNFIKLLLMYPLIMALFAIGAISSIILKSGESEGLALGGFFAVIAFFAPLFFIGATFKQAGNLFGSISGLSSKFSGKISGAAKGSDLMGLKKIAENQKSSRDYERKIRGLDRASSENRFIRTFGRLQSGTAGARGSYAGKLRQAERAESLKSANEEMAEVVQSLNPGEVRGFQESYLGARVGDTVPVGANGQEITVTRRLQEAMILQAAQSRNHRAIDAYRNMLATTGDEAATESFNRIINSNFDTFDSIMPDLTRGADIQLTLNAAGNLDPSRSFQKAVSSYDSIGEDRQSQLLAEFARLQNGSTEDRMLLAGYLTTIASSERVSEQDFLTLSTRIGAGLNLAAVRTSKGKITVGIDGAGNLVTEGDGPMEVTVV